MKTITALLITAVMICSFAACGDITVQDGEKNVPADSSVGSPVSNYVGSSVSSSVSNSVGSVEELEMIVEKDVADTVSGLRSEYGRLVSEIDTYDKYIENFNEIEDFYGRINTESREICIRMREYSIIYSELVLKSGGDNDEKYEAVGDLYDCIYDDACNDIYDEIYDDLLDDMYDLTYDGVVSDGYDYAPYGEWSDRMSEAYDMWSDCLSDVYDEWSDTLSDIYDFCSDMSRAMWKGDTGKAEEEIADFREDIEKMRAEE